MMMNMIKTGGSFLSAILCLALTSCATADRSAEIRQTRAGMDQISSLYAKSTKPHRRSVRKPVRDERARAMRLMVTQTDQVLALTAEWESDARLTAVEPTSRSEVQVTVGTFRDSLKKLRDAAARSEISQVRQAYGDTSVAYRHLMKLTDTLD